MTTLCFVVMAWNLSSAQVRFTIAPQSINATVNQDVSFQIIVSNFKDVESFQYSFNFDPTKLDYVGFGPAGAPVFGIPGFTVGGSVGATPTLLSQGYITISWSTPDGFPQSVNDNTVAMTVLFKSKVTGSVDLKFSNTPRESEVTGPNLDPNNTVIFSPAIGSTGGGGGNPCSPDTTPPTFNGCPQNQSLTTTTTCANASWTVPTASDACGNVTVTQIGGQSNGSCFTIGSSTVVYRATDAAGNSTTCSFAISVAKDVTTGGGGGSTDCVNTWTYPAIPTGDVAVVASHEVVAKAGDEIVVKIMVSNFQLIQGLGFSLKWPTSALQYVSLQTSTFLEGSSLGNFNLANVSGGVLGFNWDDPTAKGQSLSNKTPIFEITFKKIGIADAPITFDNSPVAINAVQSLNGNSIDVENYPTYAGRVSICTNNNGGGTGTNCTPETYASTLNIQKKVISANGEACVDIVCNNQFNNIDGLGGRIIYENTKLQFQRIESAGITLIDGTDYSIDKSTGTINIAWVPSSTATLSANTVLFRICFQAAGGIGSVASISFAATPAFEVIANNKPLTNATFENGNVTIKAIPQVTATNSSICGTSGTATANVSPTGNYSYSWIGPNNTKFTGKNINISLPGTYKVTVVDNVTCLTNTNETTAIMTQAPTINSLVQSVNGALVVASNANASAPTWTTKNDPTTIVATGESFNNPQAGVEYIVKVGTGQCTKEQNILAIGIINSEPTALKCGNDKNGKIALNINTGTSNPALLYKWSDANGSTTKDLSNLDKGTYTVTITSNDGKVNAIRSFTITAPDPLVINNTPVVKLAPNGSIDINVTGGTGNLTYNWVGIGNNIAYTWPTPAPFSGATTQDLLGLEPGTYTVTVTDTNNCIATISQKIDVQPITVRLKNNNATPTSCGKNNGSAELAIDGGSGTYNYIWVGPSKVTNTPLATELAAGGYSVTVSDQKYNVFTVYNIGIAQSKGINSVKINQVIDAGETCKGAIDIDVDGENLPFTYQWAGPTANISKVQDPTTLCEGIYSVTVTDAKGCTFVLADIKVDGASKPCPVISNLVQPNCPNSTDGTIQITLNGGKAPFVYQWTKDGKAYNATTKDLLGLSIGTYNVTITDAINKVCSNATPITLTSKSNLVVIENITDPSPKTAKNGTIVLSVTGGNKITYTWEDNVSTNNTATNLRAGNYTVTITDTSTGCTLVKTFTVGDAAAVEIVIRSVFNGVNVRCFGMCNGIAEIKNVEDATKPLKYKWSNGDTTAIAKGLCIGTHKVTVTDANKEQFEGTVTLVGPEKLETTIKVDVNAKSADAIVKGGTSPYIYRWHDYSTGQKIEKQEIGRLFVMVTDANGCETFANGYLGTEVTTAICLDPAPVITPNNDSYNDVLDIYCLETYKTNKLEVYNRWGQEVFIAENYQNRTWAATYPNGKPLPNGVYFYVVTVYPEAQAPIIRKASFVVMNEE
jgi:gliding motility-associated-like protein